MVDVAKVLKRDGGFGNAEVTKKGNYLTPGRYVLRINNTPLISLFGGGEAFIVEGELVESSDPEKHPVGAERSWFKSLKFAKSAFGEMKAFMYAVLGYDPSTAEGKAKIEALQPTIEAAMQSVIEQNRFRGQLVRIEVTPREKKDEKTGEVEVYNNYTFGIYNNKGQAAA